MYSLSSSVVSIIIVVYFVTTICECVPTTYGSSDYGFNGDSNSYSSHEEDYHHEPKPYAFGYSVKDFKKGTNFNQHETSDGHSIKGQYAVALPDGRMQIVSYNADWKDGYHADVKYVGEAHHPEIYGTNYGIHEPSTVSGYDYGSHGSSSSSRNPGTDGGVHSGYGSLGSSFGPHSYRK